jgi:hypothetical protein
MHSSLILSVIMLMHSSFLAADVFTVRDIPVPAGFVRVHSAQGSFGGYLRSMPLKPRGSPVLLYNGTRKANQSAHEYVIALAIGKKNLEQCADAIIRLRAEYLYSRGEYKEICFTFTSGHEACFLRWAEGYRPVVSGNRVSWKKKTGGDYSRGSFVEYLETVFTYCGTISLSRELRRVPKAGDISPGDVFIQAGSPGHAVIVVDMAVNKKTGEKIFLLAQSYMPAQEIHILKNPSDITLSPWYKAAFKGSLATPEWTFRISDLKRF